MRKVIESIKNEKLIEEGEHIIVGVSGGADSVYLLHVLCRLRKQMSLTFTVVHIHHQIRPESVDEMRFVEKLCGQLGVKCRTFSVDVMNVARNQRISLEEAGRKVRYKIFDQVMREEKGTKIAVAHHQNDQAETLLFRAVRGTGIYGAGAMKPLDAPIVRPLLCIKKQEIQDELRQMDQIWMEDGSNQDNVFARNRLRNQVIPLLEKVNDQAVEHLAFLAEDLREAGEYLMNQVQDVFERLAESTERGYRIDSEALAGEHPWMQKQVIKMGLERLAEQKKDLEKRHVLDVWKLARKGTGKRISLPYGMVAEKSYQFLLLLKSSELSEGTGVLFQEEMTDFANISEKDCIKIVDYDKIENDLQLRCRRPGDFFVFGKEEKKKLLSRYFIDEKVPRAVRDTIPLVADGSHIVWIVGRRVSDHYKISEETSRFLRLEFKREGDECDGRNQSYDFRGKSE